MTTRALGKIVEQPPAIGLLIEIGRDADRALAGDVRALLDAGERQLAVPASTAEIRTAIDALAHATKWPTEDCVLDREPFLLAMFQALQRAGFSAPVLAEAVDRLIADHVWMPGTAEVIAVCREVVAEAERGLRRVQHRVAALDAPAREVQKAIEEAVLDIEDEADPMADFRRYCAKRATVRPIERQRRIEEASARVYAVEEKLALLEAYPPQKREAARRVRQKLERALLEAREELRAAEAAAREDLPL